MPDPTPTAKLLPLPLLLPSKHQSETHSSTFRPRPLSEAGADFFSSRVISRLYFPLPRVYYPQGVSGGRTPPVFRQRTRNRNQHERISSRNDTKRISLLGVIVEDNAASDQINKVLHAYSEFIVGRMGIPYHSRGVSIISVVLDAAPETASALAAELGKIAGVSCNIVSAKN